jgi:hypothetical protein
MRHLARLQIDMHTWLLTMGCGVFEVVRWPVPADATLMQVHYDVDRNVWWAIFAHESFPAVPSGALLPELEPATIRTWEGTSA